MYLSKLTLNPRSRQVRRELSNPYEMHRTVMSVFPGKDNGGPGRVLFRLDTAGRHAKQNLLILVQSEKEPNWNNLNSDSYLLPTFDPNPAYKEFTPTFARRQQLYFRLRANPTIKRKFEGEKNSKRVGLYKEHEQLNWLHRKAEHGGFTVFGVNLTSEGKIIGRTKERHKLNMLAVLFEGMLQVTDPDRFFEILRSGIGSGKGLGFGLLSLARA